MLIAVLKEIVAEQYCTVEHGKSEILGRNIETDVWLLRIFYILQQH